MLREQPMKYDIVRTICEVNTPNLMYCPYSQGKAAITENRKELPPKYAATLF